MKRYFNLSIKQVWLLIAIFSLALPIFMPSSGSSQYFFANVIGAITVIMFVLSFPLSILGLLILFFAHVLLDINLNSMEGLYLNLFVLFVLGLVQWFWILPRLLGNTPQLQMLNLFGAVTERKLTEANFADETEFRKFQAATPLERVFQEKDLE